MLFRSNFAAFRAVVRKQIDIPHPTLPMIKETIPALRAEFGQIGSEFTYYNHLTGTNDVGAEIRGHYFDSVSAQEENDWSDEEREEVEKRLIFLSGKWPEAVQIISAPAAELPWPTYDETPVGKVAELAVALGLVEATLRYEVENLNRDEVVLGLREKLSPVVVESEELATV